MTLYDFQGFIILGKKHDGTVDTFQITQEQAQTWIDRAGFFRPVILAGFGQLAAYRVFKEGTCGREFIAGCNSAGNRGPKNTTQGSTTEGGAGLCPGCVATFGLDKGQ